MPRHTFAILDRLGEVREGAWRRLEELREAVPPVRSSASGASPFAVYLMRARELARVDPQFAREFEQALRKLEEVRDGR